MANHTIDKVLFAFHAIILAIEPVITTLTLAQSGRGSLPGLKVSLFAGGLSGPRLLRTALGGDVFVAETCAGRISVLHARDGDAHAASRSVFVEGLDGPFGIAFYPAGPAPKWIYVAENNHVVRYPYQPGDTHSSGPAQVIVAELAPTSGGHTTRDLAFSPDGGRLYVSVGLGSNVAEEIGQPVVLDQRTPVLTSFVVDDADAWGRLPGVTVIPTARCSLAKTTPIRCGGCAVIASTFGRRHGKSVRAMSSPL